jgi:hypothetical protein
LHEKHKSLPVRAANLKAITFLLTVVSF